MQKIIDYMVVWGTTQDALAEQVMKNIDTWQPLGGMHSAMFVHEGEPQYRLLQPML